MTTTTLLQTARQRGQEQTLPYAGAVTPAEAWTLLSTDRQTILIDVRTNAERDWVGKVILPETQHYSVQWNLYPGGIQNPDFLVQLQAACPDKNTVLLFLCRSGVRSRHAAKLATEHGYSHCFDILHGFEGDKNEQGHRKTVCGWCHQNLPWSGA